MRRTEIALLASSGGASIHAFIVVSPSILDVLMRVVNGELRRGVTFGPAE